MLNSWSHLADQQTISSADSSFNLPITAGYLICLASFSTQWVWLYLLFTILCFSAGQALETIYHFLTQNQIHIQPKTVSVHPTDSDLGKLSEFEWQHSNVNFNSVMIVDKPVLDAVSSFICCLPAAASVVSKPGERADKTTHTFHASWHNIHSLSQ